MKISPPAQGLKNIMKKMKKIQPPAKIVREIINKKYKK
jgi:hypothetical protein